MEESSESEMPNTRELDMLIIDSQPHGSTTSPQNVPNGGTVANIPPTTTISTIAVQAGSARIVIALLQSKEWLQLKILELEPDLTKIGSNLEEALEYQKQHEEVLLKLQGKQSPVEELLNQADQLISTQKPRAEVYAAMAESLGLAWRDLNNQLERRKQLLDQSVAFHIRGREFSERLDKAENDCRENILSSETDIVRRFLQQHHDIKKGILEASMLTLNEGQALLEKLRKIVFEGTCDSRPGQITNLANSAIYQVEHYMESLHDRRRRFEDIWTKRKIVLEQCLQLCLLYGDIAQLGNWIHTKGKEFTSFSSLGDSPPSAEIFQHDHGKIEIEAKQMQDRAIRFLRTAEQMSISGHYAGVEAESKAYELLDLMSEFTNKVDLRRRLLAMAVAFFRCAQSAITKSDQLEIQLTTTDSSRINAVNITQTIEDIFSQAIFEGRSLLSETGKDDSGVQGVVKMMLELEDRRKKLVAISSMHKEECEKSATVKSFLNTCQNIYLWLYNNGETFLLGHQDMGSVLAMVKEFLQRHEQLMKDVNNKGPEIEAVFRSFPNLLKSYPSNAPELEEEIEKLRTIWMTVNTALESRVQLARLYTNFHRLAVQLANEMDSVEAVIVAIRDGVQPSNETTASIVEEKWLAIQQIFLQMKNTGKNFKFDAKKNKDSHLDLQRAILCVDTLLDHFQNRQVQLTSLRNNWQSNVSHHKEMQTQYEKYIFEIQKTMQWITSVQIELYPIITGDVLNVQSIIWELERKLDSFLPTIRDAQTEIEAQLRSSESLKVDDSTGSETDKVVLELANLSQNLNSRIMEYQIMLTMLIAYFKKVYEIEKMVEKLEMQFTTTFLPSTIAEVENLLKEHEAGKQAILELFRFSTNERTPLVNKIKQQEPATAAVQDEEKLAKSLELIQKHWEKAWHEHKQHLEQHLQFCQFNHDLKQINNQLNELSVQLNSIKGNYGECLPAAKATSQAFIHFEKTIELLEKRIKMFVSTGEKLMSNQQTDRQHIKFEIDTLNNKWTTFYMQVGENRKLIDLAIDYFKLVEEAEDWFKEGSKLLIQIARKSTSCHTPNEANNLLNEVHSFLKPGEEIQEKRLRQLSSLATQIYGNLLPVKIDAVSAKNKEMLDSFAVINNELSTLAVNLKITENEKHLKDKCDIKPSLSPVEKIELEHYDSRKTEVPIKFESFITSSETIEKHTLKTTEAIPIQVKTEPPKVSQTPPPPADKIPKHVAPVFIVPLHDAEVVEGARFKFICRVTGFPLPEVQWCKDGIPIKNNPDYQTQYEVHTGLCSLTIEETFSEDTANFSCKAGNAAGIVETQGKLTVKETRSTESVSPPVFIREIQSTFLKVGDLLHFECEVSGEPLPIISWFKNDVCIDTSPGYAISYNNGISVLEIDKLTINDDGKFVCQATNKAGQKSSSAILTIEPVSSNYESPKFVQPLSNVMARAGQKLRLECAFHGIPEPQLTWLHNNKLISRDVKVTIDGQNAVLSIPEAFPKDAGSYVVIAKNEAGEATTNCTVTVKGRLPMETSDSEFASDMEPVKPRIIQELKNVIIKESQKARLDCLIVGQPEPEVIWYHNSVPIKESTEVQLLFEGDMCSLIIREAIIEDSGDYKVIAINSAGEASSHCTLTVKPVAEKMEGLQRRNVMLISSEQALPPKFTQLLTDVNAAEGESIILSCCVTGDPEPLVSWLKDGNPLISSNTCQIVGGKSGFQTLKINKILLSDAGTYSVKASNAAGDAKCFANLVVIGPAIPWETHSKHQHSDINESPPIFIKLIDDQTVTSGQSVTFNCIISGCPSPKIEWIFNGKTCQPHEFIISSNGDHHFLSINSVQAKNAGKFSCIAENDKGKATCIGTLKVIEPNLALVEASRNLESVDESRHQTAFSKSTMVQQSYSTKTTKVTSGSNVEIHKVTSQEEHKMQKIGDQPMEESRLSKKEEEHRTEPVGDLIIKQSTKALEDGQTMTAHVSSQFPILDTVLKKSIPPKFNKPLLSSVSQVGDRVEFEGHVEGTPEPCVKWYKNGAEIIKPEFPTIFSNGIAKLIIPKCMEKDSGKYTCTARNISGTASSTADLVVNKVGNPGPQIAPQFVRSLHAQVVKSGQKVEMDVEVTGIPKPEISWSKNGKALNSDNRCTISIKDNQSTLVIFKADSQDSGKFMVKAVNSAGEAYSVVDFVVDKEPDVKSWQTTEHNVTLLSEKEHTINRMSSSNSGANIPQQSFNVAEKGLHFNEKAPELPEFVAASSKVWTPRKMPKAEFATVEQTLIIDDNYSNKSSTFCHKSILPTVPPKSKQVFSESEDEFVRKELSFPSGKLKQSKDKTEWFSPSTTTTTTSLSKISIYSPPPTSITPSKFVPILSPSSNLGEGDEPIKPKIWQPGGDEVTIPPWKPVKPPATIAKPKPQISDGGNLPLAPSEFEEPSSVSETLYEKIVQLQESSRKDSRIRSSSSTPTRNIGSHLKLSIHQKSAFKEPNHPLPEPGPPPEFGYVDPRSVVRQHRSVVPPPPPTPTTMPKGGVPVYPGVGSPCSTPTRVVSGSPFPKVTKDTNFKSYTLPASGKMIKTEEIVTKTTIVSGSSSPHVVKDLKSPTIREIDFKLQSSSAPMFIKLLDDKVAEEGEPVTFDCVVQGDPTPDVQWFKDGQPISSDSAPQTIQPCNLYRITVPANDDNSTITCIARNPLGSATTSAALKVKAKCANSSVSLCDSKRNVGVKSSNTSSYMTSSKSYKCTQVQKSYTSSK